VATLSDVVLTGTAYVNLNTSTGLIVGTPLVIQNKGSAYVRIIISPSQPANTSTNGFVIKPLSSVTVENETDIVWATASQIIDTPVSVQQLV
jgi:hypothetical protein